MAGEAWADIVEGVRASCTEHTRASQGHQSRLVGEVGGCQVGVRPIKTSSHKPAQRRHGTMHVGGSAAQHQSGQGSGNPQRSPADSIAQPSPAAEAAARHTSHPQTAAGRSATAACTTRRGWHPHNAAAQWQCARPPPAARGRCRRAGRLGRPAALAHYRGPVLGAGCGPRSLVAAAAAAAPVPPPVFYALRG